jgi:hypothetical protein
VTVDTVSSPAHSLSAVCAVTVLFDDVCLFENFARAISVASGHVTGGTLPCNKPSSTRAVRTILTTQN